MTSILAKNGQVIESNDGWDSVASVCICQKYAIILKQQNIMQKVSGDEYTRQAQSVCYNMELSCNETVVLFLNLISDRLVVIRNVSSWRVYSRKMGKWLKATMDKNRIASVCICQKYAIILK